MNIPNPLKTVQQKSFLLFLLCFFFMSFSWIFYPPVKETVIFSAIDDALYYPKIAYNFVKTGLLTYDGITSTNGFHPLWLIFILPVSFLISDPVLGLKVIYFLIFVILSFGLWHFHKILNQLKCTVSGYFLAFFIIFLNLRSFLLFYSLIESHIILIAYISYLSFSLYFGKKRYLNSKLIFLNGVLVGLCFLARLDSFILAVPFFAGLLYFGSKELRTSDIVKNITAAVAGMSIFVIPYLAYNYMKFGNLMTVSSWMKLDADNREITRIGISWLSDYLAPRIALVTGLEKINPLLLGIPLILIASAPIAALIYIIRSREFQARLFPVYDFIFFAILHFAFVLIAAPFDVFHSFWYLVPELLLIGVLLGVTIKDFTIKNFLIIPPIIILLILLQFFYQPYYKSKKSMSVAKLETAEFIRKNVRSDARFMMFDSGIVSYFSEKNFVGLNGLIGDFEMARMIKERRLKELVAKYNISHFVTDVKPDKLDKYKNEILFISPTKTKYMNFLEGEKQFAVVKVNSDNIEDILFHLQK